MCWSRKRTGNRHQPLIQESAGFHLGISKDVEEAGCHAASILKTKYDDWYHGDRHFAGTDFKRNFFTIAVGGGNTIKAEYRALLDLYALEIDWIDTTRFFFLEESTGEKNWVSSQDSLVADFIRPLARRIIRRFGAKDTAARLELDASTGEEVIVQRMIERMIFPLDLAEASQALEGGNLQLAAKLALRESQRYQRVIQKRCGRSMTFHGIISGIGKDGTIGAFTPYTPELRKKSPGVIPLKQDNGAIRVALNRGVMINAEWLSLIVAGSLKLKALGRFEMYDSADFEQTVMETPLRILNETEEIAKKVYIFADDQALRFDERTYTYRENGKSVETRAEVRAGLEEDGIHILLLHGFMGLYTFINFLIRLPNAWTVSALRRGTTAKKLATKDIFPHYAKSLRKIILKEWQRGRPAPAAFHSIAGIISDHLLLAVADKRNGRLPEFEKLNKGDQQLIEALRAGGIIHLASYAPSDVNHILANQDNLKNHRRSGEPLDFSGPDNIYGIDAAGELEVTGFDDTAIKKRMKTLTRIMKPFSSETFVNAVNGAFRYLMAKADIQRRLSAKENPYALRIVGERLLGKISFYGLFKEVGGSQHDPMEYQQRHINALEVILEYDIPYLSIIHHDDFLVSANRHREEHRYLLQRRLAKEGVKRESDLQVPARLMVLEREEEELSDDVLNPHLMLVSTSRNGSKYSRVLTEAITRFVNENVARASAQGKTRTLPSVEKWARQHGSRSQRMKHRPGNKLLAS